MSDFVPTEEGWTLALEVPGVGCIYHAKVERTTSSEEDEPEIDAMNDEGEVDETEVPAEIWMVRANGRDLFTKSGMPWARKLLTGMTGNQISMFQ